MLRKVVQRASDAKTLLLPIKTVRECKMKIINKKVKNTLKPELLTALEKSTDYAEDRLLSHTRGWKAKNKPNFRKKYQYNKSTLTTISKVFVFNELGTRKHIIKPKRKKFLRFKPRGFNQFVFARKVKHPGTEPKRFIEKEIPAITKYFTEQLEKAIQK